MTPSPTPKPVWCLGGGGRRGFYHLLLFTKLKPLHFSLLHFFDQIPPLFQSVFLVHSFHSFDSSFRVHSGFWVDSTSSNFSCVAK